MGIWSRIKGLFIKKKTRQYKGRKNTHQCRNALMAEMLNHKYLDPYELARRTELKHQHVSMIMATAMRDGMPLERIKRQVEVPESCRGKSKKRTTVWCYRLKNQGCDIIERGTLNMPNGEVKSIQEVTEQAIKNLDKEQQAILAL